MAVAICGVCSRFGKSWIGVRKGEKVLHTMEMARSVVRRGRRKETTSCEFAGRFLVSHFTICIFCTCDVQKMRKRMYHAAAGSGIPYAPTITFLWRLWCVPARREMAGIPGVSRLTFLTLPRFSRVPGPCSYRFSLFSLWICHVLRGFCTRCCHVFPFCGCMRVHVGAYGGVRALIGACGRSRLSPRSPPRRLPCRRAARGWRRRPVGAAGRAGWGRPPPGGRR